MDNFKIDRIDQNLEKQIWDHTFSKTGNATLAAAVLANLYQESRFNHNAISSKGARGVAQLLGDKWNKYQTHLKNNNLQDNWQNQISFVLDYLNNPDNDKWTQDYTRVRDVTQLPVKMVGSQRRYVNSTGGWYPADEFDEEFKKFNPKWANYSYASYANTDWNSKTPEEAAEIFANTFERPSDSEANMDVRQGAARYFYDKYAGTQSYAEGGNIGSYSNTKKININNKEYKTYIASTDEERSTGLSEVESMDDDECMLFIFPEPIPASECIFTCEDMSFDLDIAFINTDDEIVSVMFGKAGDTEPIIPDCNPEELISYVIELNANSNIKVGDELDLDDEDISEEEINKMYILGPDGNPQGTILSGQRIFSRKDTRTLIRWAKKAEKSKKDSDYKRLGKSMFKFLDIQDNNEPEFTSIK